MITLLLLAEPVAAFKANDVLNKMQPDYASGYLDGVVEGLAYGRWLRDKPDPSGMNCIYKWRFNDPKKSSKRITAWFKRHPDKDVGALMHVLIKKDCGG